MCFVSAQPCWDLSIAIEVQYTMKSGHKPIMASEHSYEQHLKSALARHGDKLDGELFWQKLVV